MEIFVGDNTVWDKITKKKKNTTLAFCLIYAAYFNLYDPASAY
jgi:hypothetical protein